MANITLDKAIKILELMTEPYETLDLHDQQQAIKLGSEALKRLQASRVKRLADFIDPLPGED